MSRRTVVTACTGTDIRRSEVGQEANGEAAFEGAYEPALVTGGNLVVNRGRSPLNIVADRIPAAENKGPAVRRGV
jgi:hypothetical protein